MVSMGCLFSRRCFENFELWLLLQKLTKFVKMSQNIPSSLSDISFTRFVQKVSGLTTVHEVDKAYGVLTLTVFNIIPFRSYTLRPTLETFC